MPIYQALNSVKASCFIFGLLIGASIVWWWFTPGWGPVSLISVALLGCWIILLDASRQLDDEISTLDDSTIAFFKEHLER